MKKNKTLIIIISATLITCFILFVIIPFIIDRLNPIEYTTFDSLTDLKEFITSNTEITEENSNDINNYGLNHKEQFCCKFIYKDNEYILFAYVFDSIESAQIYYSRYTKQNVDINTSYYLHAEDFTKVSYTSFNKNNAWHIEGKNLKDFKEMYNFIYDNLIKVSVNN